jgi:cell division protein FtsB
VELSREEAIRLHNELKSMRERNRQLEDENASLRQELGRLKSDG